MLNCNTLCRSKQLALHWRHLSDNCELALFHILQTSMQKKFLFLDSITPKI